MAMFINTTLREKHRLNFAREFKIVYFGYSEFDDNVQIFSLE